jgi:uroporphyrinogen decarboxylase
MGTNLENFRATVEHRPPDQILYHAHYTPDLQRRLIEHTGTENLAAHYGYGGNTLVGLRKPDAHEPIDYSLYYADEELPDGTQFNGAGCARIPSGFYHFFGYVSPLRNATSLKEIESYPLEDYSRWGDSHMVAAVEQAHAEGRSVDASIGHIYETSWQIRGYEQFLMDTIDRPAWADAILEKVFQQKWDMAIPAARAGVDRIKCGDDVANQKALMFNKDTWRRLIHSRWSKLWAEIKRISPSTQILYHSDGNIYEIIGELVDAGLDILNPLQPECLDVDRVHREFGHLLTFDGTIGTQSTMPWGTPHEVRTRVRDVIDKYGRNGGLIISPTHILEPEVPIENVDAFFDECRTYGNLAGQ